MWRWQAYTSSRQRWNNVMILLFTQNNLWSRNLLPNVHIMLKVSQLCISKFLKRWNYRNNVWNLCWSGAPRTSDNQWDRQIICYVKCNKKQTLKEIMNTVNQILPQPLSSCTVRHCLCSRGFTKICKTIVISRMNRVYRVSWCRHKLTWYIKDHWKRVILTDEAQVVIGQNNKVYVWRSIQHDLATVEVKKYLLCSGVVFLTLALVL